MNTSSSRLRAFAVVTAVLGWGTLVLKLVVALQLANEDGRGTIGATIGFFTAFSIWANILAAVALTALIAPHVALGKYFARPAGVSAVAAVMLSVALVYSLLLRATWHPQGLQWVADEGLHDVMPALVLVYWWLAVPRSSLRWGDAPGWTLYPLAYFAFLMMRGAVSGMYAYHFIDAGFLGYGRVLLNAAGGLLAFLAVSVALVAAKSFPRTAQLPNAAPSNPA
ncbi:MAG TPA: Pr6Pr family membrane protein [Gemmatimonadaceae bacterium]